MYSFFPQFLVGYAEYSVNFEQIIGDSHKKKVHKSICGFALKF